MAFSLFKFDWRKSPAHLLLLSEFLSPNEKQKFIESDPWKSVLKQNAEKAINRFLEEGMIEKADINGMLSYKYKVSELKEKLKKLGLKLSGKKEELVARIISVDEENIKRELRGLNIYQCTEQGKIIAEQYKENERTKRVDFKERTYQALQQNNFLKASQIVAKYEAEKVFPSNIGIDWKHYDSTRDVMLLKTMFYNKPKILKNLKDDQMKILRVAAGMIFLWKFKITLKWPEDFKTELIMDNFDAAKMIHDYALYKERIDECKKNKMKKIAISCAANACEACKKLAEKTYKLNQAPELPYENCTSKNGCNCIAYGLYS